MRSLTYKEVYLTHGKQILEWLWVFQPWFLSWMSVSHRIWTPRGFGLPGPNSLARYMDPPSQICSPLPKFPFKHLLYHIWWRILFSSFFVDVLFNYNTTLLNKGKEKQPFGSNPAAFIIASRAVYARIRCEQTAAFKRLKL